MSNHENLGFGDSLRALLRGIASIVRTGSWQIEHAAGEAVSSEEIADHMKDAADEDAQETLDVVNDGLTSFYKLQNDLEDANNQVEVWAQRAQEAAEKYKAATDEGQKATLRQLGESALREKAKAEMFRDQLQAEYDKAKPAADEALQVAEEAGFQRDKIMSQTEVLSIKDASAQARTNLAKVKQAGGHSKARELFDEYQGKVSEHMAQAEAGKAIADVMPKNADEVAAELDRVTRDSDVTAEFDKLTQS